MDPHRLYMDRLAEREAAYAHWDARWRTLSRLRAVVFLVAILLVAVLLRWDGSALWLLMPLCAFMALAALHARVHRRRDVQQRAAEHYREGLERLAGRWSGRGPEGLAYLEAGHPYAEHLDLFGTGSLFQRICRATTLPGQQTLAGWLSASSPLEVLQQRRAAVDELRPELDLRERLEVRASERASGLDPARLRGWAAKQVDAPSTLLRAGVAALALYLVLSLAAWIFGFVSGWFFLAGLAAAWAVELRVGRRMESLMASVEAVAGQLDSLAQLTEELENSDYQAALLCELRAAVEREDGKASGLLRSLRRRLELYDSARNLMFAPLAFLLLWRAQIGLGVQSWTAKHQDQLSPWLSALGEFEALLSISGYAFENPQDPWPELTKEACYEGEGLGHPLLPLESCVRNDIRLDEDLRLYVISGSNMSGKSTMLRTVGLNAVLALAGAPVRAQRLRLSRTAVGASLRIVDSLPAGISHFYAEVKRLRELRELTDGPLPVLLLLDEIFHGTNSHDRRLGASAVLRKVVTQGAFVLVTTHDLALAGLADALHPIARNVHFEDQVRDERMYFDYRMHPGVAGQGNALRILQNEGLLEEGDLEGP